MKLFRLVCLVALAVGCSKGGDTAGPASRDEAPATFGEPSSKAAEPPAETELRERGDLYDLVTNAASCEMHHRGQLLDLGTRAAPRWQGFQARPFDEAENVIRDGATLLRPVARQLSYDFWLEEAAPSLDISVRARGLSTKFLYVDVDGKRAAPVRLNEEELKVVALPPLAGPFAPGRHRLTLRFPRGPRGSKAPVAELDWVRIGGRDTPPSSYAAPTLTDVVSDVVLAKTPRRSFVLRQDSTVRCYVRPSPDARLKLALGFWGAGTGVASVRVVRDGQEPVALTTRKLVGGDGATWTPVELDLGAYATDVIGLELSALEATRGGRVAFGDPVIERKEADPEPMPLANTVVLIVLSSVNRASLPPWGPTGQLVAFGELARHGVAFSRYRAPSTVAASVLATLLTGLLPREHRLEDPSDRLSPALRGVQRIIKEASGRAAMFTSVPTSFPPFGFDENWDVYEAYSPIRDIGVSEPFVRAARWLDRELEENKPGKRFVVIHARGAHPPWDVSREEALQLKPPEYSGAIDPRRAGIVIGALRAKTRRNVKRLTDEDWIRLAALEQASLAKQNEGLARLISVLQNRKAWDASLIMVVGDVASPAPPDLPFETSGPLTEDRLAAPLIVKFPNNAFAGQEVHQPSNAPDLTLSVLSAFGLRAPENLEGIDLYRRARGRAELTGTAQVASLPGRYATRLGPWLLRGTLGQVPTLCALDVDPACSSDAFDRQTIAARAVFLATYAAETRASDSRLITKTPATLDKDTRAALAAWGDLPP
jgi:hypothetical protein